MATTIPGMSDLVPHHLAMEGGDDSLVYAETGELVIPLKVQREHPALVLAAMQAIQKSGGNPSQYFVGSKQGNYNDKTGQQQFGWEDWIINGVDWLADSRIGQSVASAAVTYGTSKLTGASNKQALASAAGAGLGYYAGDAIGQGFENLTYNKDNKDAITAGTMQERGFFETPTVAARTAPSGGVGDAFMNLYENMSTAGMTGAGLGATAGYMLGAPKPNIPKLDLSPANSELDNIPTSTPTETIDTYFNDNERANQSAAPPTAYPVGAMTPAGMNAPGGVNYKTKVKDRDTGQYSYVNLDNNDAAAFSRSLQGANRRRRLGFGDRIII